MPRRQKQVRSVSPPNRGEVLGVLAPRRDVATCAPWSTRRATGRRREPRALAGRHGIARRRPREKRSILIATRINRSACMLERRWRSRSASIWAPRTASSASSRDGVVGTVADPDGTGSSRRSCPSTRRAGWSGAGARAPAPRRLEHHLLGQAPHRPRVGFARGAAGPRQAPVRAARGAQARRRIVAARGEPYSLPGDQRVRAAPGQGRRGGLARRARRARRHHGARQLQRSAARGDEDGRHASPGSRSCAS